MLTATRAHSRASLPGFIWTLVRTDFKSRYHGTIGGFGWALLKPLAMVFVLVGVFSFVFAADRDYAMNVIIGLFLYEFFADATKVGLHSLRAKGYLITRTRAPRWLIVVASISNAVITLAVFAVAILVILHLRGHRAGLVGLVLFAWYLVQYLLIAVGISLGASVLFLRYRDLNQVWEVVTQAGLFVAPVIYPLAILPERVHAYLYLWPPTAVIQFSRMVLLEDEVPTLRGHLSLALMTAVVLAVGALVFRRHSRRVAEYL
jgi:lipopolysaccharide transport system permease protein